MNDFTLDELNVLVAVLRRPVLAKVKVWKLSCLVVLKRRRRNVPSLKAWTLMIAWAVPANCE